MVHFKKICGCDESELYEARIFKTGSYKKRSKWYAGFNVHIQGTKAFISMLDRGWNRKVYAHTASFCQGKGVETVRYERKGEMKTVILIY